jgi:excinuclease UvrABC nuclease subunit
MSRRNTQYAYINAFNLIPGIGPKKLYLLAGYFDTFEHAWKANADKLMSAGISEKLY